MNSNTEQSATPYVAMEEGDVDAPMSYTKTAVIQEGVIDSGDNNEQSSNNLDVPTTSPAGSLYCKTL